jgi:excisionase family DNA binding protein
MQKTNNHNPLPERLLSLSDAAKILGYSLKTIRRRVDAGELAIIRDGRLVRVHPDDLNRYIQSKRIW